MAWARHPCFDPAAARPQGQPGRSCGSCRPERGRKGSQGWEVLGSFRLRPPAPSISASPQEGAGSRPQQQTQPRWAVLAGQEPGHRGTSAEPRVGITPDTAGDVCCKCWCASPAPLQPWGQRRIGPTGLAVLHSTSCSPSVPAQQRHGPPERKPPQAATGGSC